MSEKLFSRRRRKWYKPPAFSSITFSRLQPTHNPPSLDGGALRFGFTQAQRPIHVQCSYPQRPIVKVITVYEPTPMEWIDYRTRR